MNTNLEVDNEEEQRIQYVNRPSISLPSGGAITFNLNIVNQPGLSGIANQGYILNSVNPVSQNIVAYQSPVTLQSYIALPGENGNNIVNNLPVGVVPVGLPMSAELLQNPALVNTSIIIGNEECNSPMIFKPSPNDVSDHGEYKISYVQKAVMGEFNNGGVAENQNIRLNNASGTNSEGLLKKPCPLEMSIKAANIDLEFDEKCDSEPTIAIENGIIESASIPIIPILKQEISQMPQVPVSQLGNIILGENIIDGNIIKQNSESSQVEDVIDELKKPRTEITWDNKEVKVETGNNDFHESLICEVEEANDEDEDSDEDSGENEGDDNENDEVSDNSSVKKEVLSSEEESDVPLSEVLKLEKVPDINKNDKAIKKSKVTGVEDVRIVKKESKRGRPQRVRKQVDLSEYSVEWNESDEDVLDLKRIKNEFNYNCYYEPKTLKSTGIAPTKDASLRQKFAKVRNCCSKKECYKKIALKDQKTAYKNFYDLESKLKQDTYLVNCLEHVQRNRTVLCEDTKENNPISDENPAPLVEEKIVDNLNIQLEIENESNGNQMLSDEIQNAINESLKDCLENQQKEEERNKEIADSQVNLETSTEQHEVTEVKDNNHWNYYIVIDRCRKKVCLQFLIKLFRIPKSRIKTLQKKILSGTPLSEDIPSPSDEKNSKIWETAKSHLATFDIEECEDCHANPRHSYFFRDITRKELFDEFKEYYLDLIGSELDLKYAAYKRFLARERNFSFMPKKKNGCSECLLLEKQQRKEREKLEKAVALQNRIKNLDRCVTSKKKGKKKWESSDSEDYLSEDEPLSKRRKLKLKISLKSPNKIKNSSKKDKKITKKEGVERRGRKKSIKDEKSKSSGTKGRDVWSLMLLHLESMPYKICRNCVSKKKHKFFDSTMTTQALYEDYRKYFLKETNSELGLGYTMYEKYFEKNCGYTIKDVDVDSPECPRCALEPPKPESNSKAKKNLKNSNIKINKKLDDSSSFIGNNCRS